MFQVIGKGGRFMRKILAVIISISMIFCFAVTASAETNNDYGVAPCYQYAASVASLLAIDGTTASCESVATGISGVTKITMVQTLEKHWALGIFFRVDNASWTTTEYSQSATVINKKYNMESGTYRMVTDFTFYYGDQTETITVYSAEDTVA